MWIGSTHSDLYSGKLIIYDECITIEYNLDILATQK